MRMIYWRHVNAATVDTIGAVDKALEGLHEGEVVLVRSDGDGNQAQRRIASIKTQAITDIAELSDGTKVPNPESAWGKLHVSVTFEPHRSQPSPDTLIN
jgi:hypothetical protein